MTESSGHSYLQDQAISGEALELDFSAESKDVLGAARTSGAGRSAKTLVKEGPLRVVLLGMKSGASLKEHEADGPASVHVLSGEVKITASDRTDDLEAGRAIVFDSRVMHSLEAKEDSVILLTIALST